MLTKQKLTNLINELLELGHEPSTREFRQILRKYPKSEGGFYSKSEIIRMFEESELNVGASRESSLQKIRKLLRMKPTRTISGVAPITIFTKPYPCPGGCIFCPTQENMPKSYLKEEPGAMRAESLKFDPYEQVRLRIQALKNIGHNTDKIELIISGGTWSFYPKDYREWFIEQSFKALYEMSSDGVIPDSDPGSRILKEFQTADERLRHLHKLNEAAKHRCVGLVIETRPDYIDEEEVKHLRKLGVTKVQLGIQTLDDKVLELNKRGHSSDDSRKAINLLRLAGFKIHIHWMANLYGSDLKNDYKDFKKLFEKENCHPEPDEGRQFVEHTVALRQAQCDSHKPYPISPDELKIYPCSVLENTPIFKLYEKGKHKPYTDEELTNLLAKCKTHIPKYCRVSRLVRDIPSQLIEGGTKKTNLRQLVQSKMKEEGLECSCIRCREIRSEDFDSEKLQCKILSYETEVSEEKFLSYEVNNKIVGFLRLSLPKKNNSQNHFIEELKNSAIIREIHVYGRALKIGGESEAQHLGLGRKLMKQAEEIVTESGYSKIAVISAIGTRGYYRKNGFQDGNLYQYKTL